jgi:cytoskeletal protein CcmA (bactofilin family)
LLLGGATFVVAACAYFALASPASSTQVCTNSWISAGNGAWLTGSNWSAGHAPNSSDVACITSGSPIVTLQGNATVAGLVVGDASDHPTLTVQGAGCVTDATLTVGGDVDNFGTISESNVDGSCHQAQTSDVNWTGTLTNSGTIATGPGAAGGPRQLRGALTSTGSVTIGSNTSYDQSGATLDNQGNVAIADATTFTIASTTLVNDTAASISETGSGSVAVSNGTFTQASTATAGANPTTLNGSTLNLNASGSGSWAYIGNGTLAGNVAAAQTVTIEGRGCTTDATVTGPSGSFTNAGTITESNAPGSCHQAQAAALSFGSLTNSGTISTAAGDAGGNRYLRGNLTNTGTINVGLATTFDTGSTTLDNQSTVTITTGATLNLSGTTFLNDTGASVTETGTGSIAVSNGTLTQASTATAGANPTTLSGSTLNLNASGSGSWTYLNSGTLSGNVAAAQTVTIEGRGCITDATVTGPSGAFTNAGTITETNAPGSCHQAQTAELDFGSLTNTGTIATTAGDAGGARYLRGDLTNKTTGSVTIGADTHFDKSGAAWLNKAPVTINASKLTLANGSFDNQSSLTMADTTQLVMATETFTQDTTGTMPLSGSANTAATNSTFTLTSTGGAVGPVSLAGSTLNLNGPAAGEFSFIANGTLNGNVSASQSVTIEGRGCTTDATVTGPSGTFTNAGTITLSNIGGACNQAQTAELDFGTMNSSGTVATVTGTSGGNRILRGNITNTGTVNVGLNTSDTLPTTTLDNASTITIATGATLTVANGSFVNDTGGSVSETGTGGITLNTGTFTQNSALTTGANSVNLIAATLDLNSAGAGSFAFLNNGTLAGNVASTQTVFVTGRGCTNDTTVTGPGGAFTNAGTIALTNIGGACNQAQTAELDFGTMTNTGTVITSAGTAGGGRHLRGNVLNKNSVSLGVTTTYDLASSTFDNKKTVNLASGAALAVSNATFLNDVGGSVVEAGTGSITVASGSFTQASTKSAGVNATTLAASTLNLNGTGAGTWTFVTGGTLTGNVATAQTVVLVGRGCSNDTTVSAPASFTNAGAIGLSNIGGTCVQGQTAELDYGTLTNSGSITTVFGTAGGSRLLRGNLVNTGTVSIQTNTSFDHAGASFDNQGTVSFTNGAVLTDSAAPFTEESTATLQIVASTGGGGHLAVLGSLTLAGKLSLVPATAFKPVHGMTYTVVTCATSCNGPFANDGGSIPHTTKYNPTFVTVTVVLPSIAVTDASVVEPSSGTASLHFTATLSSPSPATVKVKYATVDGTATVASGDYAAASGTLTFAPGVTQQSVDVTVNGDTLREPNETLTLKLTGPTNSVLGDATGVGTIIDPLGPFGVSVTDASVLEPSSGTTTETFTVSLSAVPQAGESVSVNVATADGTATVAGGDYDAIAQTLTFSAGQQTRNVNVTVHAGPSNEGTETYSLDLSAPSENAVVSDASATGTIFSTPQPAPIGMYLSDGTLLEPSSGTATMPFTVSLDQASAGTVTAHYATHDGTAKAASDDYVATSGTVTFSPGQMQQTVNVSVNSDAFHEPNETFTLALTAPSGAVLGDASGLGTIVDPNGPFTISVGDTFAVQQTATTTTASFVVSLSAVPQTGETVTVKAATVDGTATVSDGDYDAVSQTLTFLPGQQSITVNVTVNSASPGEASEQFTMKLSNASKNATIADTSASALIAD